MNPSLVTPELFVRGNPALSISTSADLERLSSKGPLEHYRFCRALLNRARHSIQLPDASRSYEAAMSCPCASSYQPSIAALALLSHMLGAPQEKALVPQLFPSHAPIGDLSGARMEYRLLPIPIARELIKLWEELANRQQDEKLQECVHDAKRWLVEWGSHAELLFYREKEFDEEEICRKNAEDGGRKDDYFGAAGFCTKGLQASFSLSGWNTGLGTMKIDDVEIRAFGPQRFPLSDPSGFGIAQIPSHGASIQADRDHLSLSGWSRCFVDPSIWLYMNAQACKEFVSLDIRWAGIEPCIMTEKNTDVPFAMVFFVHAPNCMLEDNSILHPNSLIRYQGKMKKMRFGKKVQLECSETLNVHVIPLAGFGCFWNATFLVAFECSSSQNEASFRLFSEVFAAKN
jgi:hypothetical protein